MIDAKFLDYTLDEEADGFGEPPRPEPRPKSVGERIAVAGIALGLLALTLALASPAWNGSWSALAASLGLLSSSTAGLFLARFRGTTPGVQHDGTFFRGAQNRGWIAWGLGVFVTGFYVVLYFYDDLLAKGLPPVLERGIRLVDPLAQALTGKPADRWFLYGTLYTLAILVFGVRMFMKYRHNRYHLIRTASVMFFQLAFAFLIPNLLKLFHEPEFYFSYFWPLKREYLFPGELSDLWNSSRLGVFMVLWGVILALVGAPVLTYWFGKRWYCSWVCGCGGLAETLGDPWRQLSDKSTRAWTIERWMIHAVLVFIVVVTALLWINSAMQGRLLHGWSAGYAKVYGLWIGAVFSGVVGVGFYPLMGSRVWCRFGCPQAAILGLFQRFFSRFRITTNGDQCMSCGNCSTYCEMGIDVRSYAQRGENIVRASCVGCGVCAAVCPRGVLALENGSTHRDRFENADDFFANLKHSLERSDRA